MRTTEREERRGYVCPALPCSALLETRRRRARTPVAANLPAYERSSRAQTRAILTAGLTVHLSYQKGPVIPTSPAYVKSGARVYGGARSISYLEASPGSVAEQLCVQTGNFSSTSSSRHPFSSSLAVVLQSLPPSLTLHATSAGAALSAGATLATSNDAGLACFFVKGTLGASTQSFSYVVKQPSSSVPDSAAAIFEIALFKPKPRNITITLTEDAPKEVTLAEEDVSGSFSQIKITRLPEKGTLYYYPAQSSGQPSYAGLRGNIAGPSFPDVNTSGLRAVSIGPLRDAQNGVVIYVPLPNEYGKNYDSFRYTTDGKTFM